MKIAITSANGQLGRSIIKKAIQEFGKNNVIGLARTPEKATDLGIEIRKGDYNIPQHFIDGLKGIEVVLIISGNEHPDKRIEQHRNIINGAKAAGVRKIVYTSIAGNDSNSGFSAIIQSNRISEADIAKSGLQYAIGRNGLYIEPDLDYIPTYLKKGEIMNSAGNGQCGYTSREELANAYLELIKNDDLNSGTYNLFGEKITQQELTDMINAAHGIDLKYHAVSIKEYEKDRIAANGDFFGKVIAGIYEGINKGSYNLESDYEKVCNRPHKALKEIIEQY